MNEKELPMQQHRRNAERPWRGQIPFTFTPQGVTAVFDVRSRGTGAPSHVPSLAK